MEHKEKPPSEKTRSRNQGRWLLLGVALSLVSNGRWIFWPAAWLAPFFLIRYFRSAERPWRAFLAAGALLTLVGAVNWFGLMPFPPLVFAQIVVTGALTGLVCYGVDRLTHQRHRGFLQTLVFPLTCVSLELLHWERSGSTWGSIGYTQASFLPFVQLAAVTGLSGLGFFVSWFASWGNWVWETWGEDRKVGRLQLAYPILLALVLVGGQIRLGTAPPENGGVRVASVTQPDILDFMSMDDVQVLQQHLMKQTVDPARFAEVRSRLEETYDELFRLTRHEARGGAEIVVWPEGGLIAFGEARQHELLQRARELAREEGVYLGVTLALIPDDRQELNENKALLISPEGEMVGEYFKTHLVPHLEEPVTRAGDGTIDTVETPYGKLATVICYDADHPRYIAQLKDRDVALLLVPSGDWPAIKHLHAAMARLRAVEVGIPMVRPANHGLTQIVSARGRVLAEMDHYDTETRILQATVTPGSRPTPYSRWGDVLAWMAAAAWAPVVLLSAFAFRRRQLLSEPGPATSLPGPQIPAER
jgi:apolipoprotein N-acyltransferase